MNKKLTLNFNHRIVLQLNNHHYGFTYALKDKIIIVEFTSSNIFTITFSTF